MAALATPALLWLGTRREGGRRVRALAAPLLALALVTMLLSTSRASLLAAAVGAAFWFVLVPRRIRGASVLGLAAIGAGAVMAWGFQQKGLTDDGVRLATRSDAGTFSTARTHFREDTVAAHHAHGYVVQELAELGLAGAAASLFALVAWMLAAARAGGARPRVPAALARAIRRRPPPATAAGP